MGNGLKAVREWHLITGEYPPQSGGVSDYSFLVASGLAAAGDAVHVWCPPATGQTLPALGVTVHRELGSIKPDDLHRVGRLLNDFGKPRRLLLQWVPHGYGYRSMNLAFCWWLWRRAVVHHDHVEIMVHEPYLAFGAGTWKQNAAAMVHRLMTIILLQAARQVWVSIPAWEACWQPYTLGRRVPFRWLPVPSNVPVIDDPARKVAIRARYAPTDGLLVGHFGTYGRHMAEALFAVLPSVLARHPQTGLLLLGRGSEAFRDKLAQTYPELADRMHATGPLAATPLSLHLSACDLMIQPYPGGISSRNTSVMAALSHCKAIVATWGYLTEPVWQQNRAVALAPDGNLAALIARTEQLLGDEAARNCLSATARELYQKRFDIQHTISALRHPDRDPSIEQRSRPCASQ